MKIRTDFVTNSSSSNYCVEVSVFSKQGEKVRLHVEPTDEYSCGGGQALIRVGEKSIRAIKTIDELYEMIVGSIEFIDAYGKFEGFYERPDDCTIRSISAFIEKLKGADSFDEEEYEEYGLDYFERVQKDARRFHSLLKEKIFDVSNISKIVISQEHDPWGEFCDLLDYVDYPHDATLDEIRKHLESILSADSDIDGIMSCIEQDYMGGGYSSSKTTTFDFKTGKTSKVFSITGVEDW